MPMKSPAATGTLGESCTMTSPNVALNGPRSVTENPVPFAFGWMNFTLNAFEQVPPPLIVQRTITELMAPEAVAGWVRSTYVAGDAENCVAPCCGNVPIVTVCANSNGVQARTRRTITLRMERSASELHATGRGCSLFGIGHCRSEANAAPNVSY